MLSSTKNNELGYKELGYYRTLRYYEQSVITNRILAQICHIRTEINPAITNPGCNVQKWPVHGCSKSKPWTYVRYTHELVETENIYLVR
jgi:hypothetical protein